MSNHRRKELDLRKLTSKYDVHFPDDSVLNEFCVKFEGPSETPYHGGIWKVLVSLPNEYPYKSPSIGFMNRIFHPNVDEMSGSVCLDVINQTWSPMFDLVNIFDAFLPQLLRYPNPSDPLNGEAASILLRNEESFRSRARDCVRKYASKDFSFDEEMDVDDVVTDSSAKSPDISSVMSSGATDVANGEPVSGIPAMLSPFTNQSSFMPLTTTPRTSTVTNAISINMNNTDKLLSSGISNGFSGFESLSPLRPPSNPSCSQMSSISTLSSSLMTYYSASSASPSPTSFDFYSNGNCSMNSPVFPNIWLSPIHSHKMVIDNDNFLMKSDSECTSCGHYNSTFTHHTRFEDYIKDGMDVIDDGASDISDMSDL